MTFAKASGGLELSRPFERADQRLLAIFRADLNALGDDEFEICDTDEAKDRTQVGFQMLGRLGRGAGAIEAAARNGDDHALVASQALRPGRAVAEGLARDQDAV